MAAMHLPIADRLARNCLVLLQAWTIRFYSSLSSSLEESEGTNHRYDRRWPIFSVVTAVICAYLAKALGPNSSEHLLTMLGGIAVWSGVGAATSFFPTAKPWKSDGRHVIELLWGKTDLLRRSVISSLVSRVDELRPREWDEGLVSLALDDSIDISLQGWNFEPTLQWLRYNWSADTGCTEVARTALEWLLSSQARESDRLNAQWESVWFEVFSKDNLLAAQDRLRVAEEGPAPGPPVMVWKARAAVAAAEGQHEQAREAATKAISALTHDPTMTLGFAKAIEDDLNGLLKRARFQHRKHPAPHREDPASGPS